MQTIAAYWRGAQLGGRPRNRRGLYRAGIDHALLLKKLGACIDEPQILDLLAQYLNVAERGGLFWEIQHGISLGCPLIPLIGAYFLRTVDERPARMGVFYVRYMDDILVMTASRCKLRSAVRAVNQELQALKLEKHPDKPFIGRIS